MLEYGEECWTERGMKNEDRVEVSRLLIGRSSRLEVDCQSHESSLARVPV
jgi:hypothetical protein